MEEKRKILVNIIAGVILAVLIISIINVLPWENILSKADEKLLMISITDPPLIPDGIEAIYLSYSNILIHDQDKGWIPLNVSGEVSLIDAIDFAYVLFIDKIKANIIDSINLIIKEVKVDYLSNNITVVNYSNEINVKFEPIKIKEKEINAINIHIIPHVIPVFENDFKLMLKFFSKAYSMNIHEIFPNIKIDQIINLIKAKRKFSIKGSSIYQIINQEFKNSIKILNATLSYNKLEIFIENLLNKSIIINTIILYKLISFKFDKIQKIKINFLIFLINNEGKIMLPKSLSEIRNHIIKNQGYELKPNEVVNLSYNGEIKLFSFERVKNWEKVANEPIKPFEKYILIVIGSEHSGDKEIVFSTA